MATPKAQTRKKDHSGSPNTPLSPSVLTRRDEKDQMVNLNNRLAIYIEKIRSLETENHRLHVQISSYEETSTVEITNLKGMYENEISEARRLLDELAKEKAQLQIEGSSLRDRADAEKTRASDLARENSVLEVKLKEISKRMRTREVQTANAIKERDDAVEELDSLKGKFADLTQELETTRQLLEQETLQRVDYENKLQSLKEELHFKEKLHHEEVKESRKRHAFSVTEIDERVKMDYDSKMETSLADLRDQQACDIEQLKDDLESQYKLKISALRSQTDSSRRALMQMQEGNKSSELKIDRLQTSVQLMQNENNIFSNKIRDLEGKLETAEEIKRAAVTVVERERNEARIRLEEMESEYAELLNLKLNLDMEIATYRKLLEEEESRLNISPSPAGDSKSRTRAGRKRKRAGQIESQQISQKAKKQDSTMTTITSETVTVEQTTRQRVEGDPENGDEKTCTIM